MLRVVDLSNTPRVDSSADRLAIYLDFLLGADNGEWHHGLHNSVSLTNV